jgi:hypothetical protein
MSPLPCRAAGGAILSDIGPMGLAAARDLARFYQHEAALGGRHAGACRERASALHAACLAAERWRRAAGWTQPERADQA